MGKWTGAALAVAFSGAACAATNEVTTLAPVVVYASRVDETADRLAAQVRIIAAAEIARSGARDVPELLARAANVQVRTLNANPLQAQVALHGFGENSFGRVRIVVDGEVLDGVDMESPNLARIPLDSVERVEVIAGPSPVLYGDGAVAGVINITTDARDAAQETRVSARGGSYGTFGAGARTKGGVADEGLLYSASYDYDRSDGYRRRSGYDLHSGVANLRKEFANGAFLGLKANYFNALYEMPGALTRAQWKRDPTQTRYDNDSCRLWNYGLVLDGKAKLADGQWLFLDGVFSVRHRTSRWGDYGYANEYDLYGYQLSPRYVNERPLGDFESRLTAGLDFKYDRYEVSDRSGYNNPFYAFDRARYAPYAREELDLSDTLTLAFGARGEYVANRWSHCRGLAQSYADDRAGDFELGLVFRPFDGLKTYAKGTRFHRSAFCDELNYTEDGRFLEPETGWSLDAGMEYAFAREFRFELAGYGTVIRDEIFYNPHAKDYGGGQWGGYNCNSPGKTGRIGFDAGLVWRRDKVAEASVRYGFVEARFLDGEYEDRRVPLVPESRVRAEVGVWLRDDLEVKGGYRYVTRQVLSGDYGNERERLPGYSLFDCGAYYEPSWAKGWQASLVMGNLFDRDYCDFAGWSDYGGTYYYPASGRSFLFTVSYAF